jgi:hypothetical protein
MGSRAIGWITGAVKTAAIRNFCVLVLVLAVAAVVIVGAPLARADQPAIAPAPASDYVDTTSCAFRVAVHFAVNDEVAKTFTSGTTVITGPLFATYSANGKSVTLNISGPGTASVSGGSVLIIGHGVAAGPLVTPDGLVLSYVAGVVSISTSPTLQGVLERGTVLLNICNALAP